MSSAAHRGHKGHARQNSHDKKALKVGFGSFGSVKGLSGKHVWISHPTKLFVKASVEEDRGDTVKIKTAQGEEFILEKSKLLEVNPQQFNGVDDLVEMPHLNEPSLLDTLRHRYVSSPREVYTYSGLFLIAINPYEQLPIYGPDQISLHKGRQGKGTPPHLFALADKAYRNMLEEGVSQSILITGESGSGKTRSTAHVLEYLVATASHESQHNMNLEKKILESNPLLEAFGNAKTIRNNNSSRFGKFIQIHFSRSGFISGASIAHFLLEKTRVVTQSTNERNFHIFYQLLTGADSKMRHDLQLNNFSASHFAILSQSGCTEIDGVDDKADFEHTRKALSIVGVSDEVQLEVFKVLAGILHLGNLKFHELSTGGSEVSNTSVLDTAASLLGCTSERLGSALLRPRITAGKNETVATQQTPQQASFNRDALCKALYTRLFDWIVATVNSSFVMDKKRAAPMETFIGILDMAGFEIFARNDLVQLLINFTNENLQHFFSQHFFKHEQAEYIEEHIQWETIDFKHLDLTSTIELIEKPLGVLSLLDEQCLFPQSTDKSYVDKLEEQHGCGSLFKRAKFGDDRFSLKHYAGEVTYTCEGWLEKNRDAFQNDSRSAMTESSSPFVAQLFQADVTAAANAAASDGDMKGKRRAGSSFQSVASSHRKQLAELMAILSATSPSFIRCILPNNDKKAGSFDSALILEQLRSNGVLDGVRIAKQGFPTRIKFADFLRRYGILVPKSMAISVNHAGASYNDIQQASEVILEENLGAKSEDRYRVGRTKIFFRASQLAKIEEMRELRVGKLVSGVQRAWRRYMVKLSAIKLQRKDKAARVLQKAYRNHLAHINSPWIKLMRAVRPLLHIKNYPKMLAEKEQEVAQYQKDLTVLQDRLQMSDVEMTRLTGLLHSTNIEILNSEATTKDLKKQFEEAQKNWNQEKNSAADRISQLQNDLVAQRKQGQDDNARLNKQADQQKLQMEEEIQMLRTRIAALESDLAMSRERIMALESNSSTTTRDFEARFSKIDKERKQLQTANSTLSDEKDALKSSVQKLEMKLTAATQAQDGLMNKIASMDNMRMESDAEKVALLSDISRLERENGRQKTEMDSLRQQVEADKHANEDLRSEFNKRIEGMKRDLSSSKNGHEKQLADLMVQVASLQESLRVSESEKHQMDVQLRLSKAQLSSAQIECSDVSERLEKELNDIKGRSIGESAALRTKLEALQSANERLESELEQSKEGSDSIVAKLQTEVTALRSKLRTAEEKSSINEAELLEQNHHLTIERDELKNKFKDTHDQLQRSQRSLETAQSMVQNLESLRIRDQNENAIASADFETKNRTEMERLQREISRMEKAVRHERNSSDAAQKALREKLNASMDALTAQNDNLAKDISDLRQKLQDAEKKMSTMDIAMFDKENEMRRCNDKLRHSTTENQMLLLEIEELKDRISEKEAGERRLQLQLAVFRNK